jgi:hypothetical protein
VPTPGRVGSGTCSRRPAAFREPLVSVNVVVLQPLIALVAGILILMVPRLLNYIVAVYLILVGIAGLSGHFMLR